MARVLLRLYTPSLAERDERGYHSSKPFVNTVNTGGELVQVITSADRITFNPSYIPHNLCE